MPPIFKKIIPWILILPIIFSLAIISLPIQVEAQTNAELTKSIEFEPQITIPGSEFQSNTKVNVGSFNETTGKMQSDLLGRYMLAIINYALAAVAILATVVLMGGGLLWLTSRGDSGQIGKAKGLIGGSLTGMILLLCSWIILNTINPDLTKFKSVDTKVVDPKNYQVLTCCNSKTGPVETKILIKDGKKIAIEGQHKGKAIRCIDGYIECGGNQVCVNIDYGKFECKDNIFCCECKKPASFTEIGLQNHCKDNSTKEGCEDWCKSLKGAWGTSGEMKLYPGFLLCTSKNQCINK